MKTDVSRKGKGTAYPYIGFRPPPKLERRVKRVARAAGVKVSAIVVRCAEAHLPELEKHLGLEVEEPKPTLPIQKKAA